MKHKRPFARHKKRLLWWSSGVCVVALALGGLYEWNNRVPMLSIPQATSPLDKAYDHYARAAKLYVAPVAHIPDSSLGSLNDQPPLYSADYQKRYPLVGQRAFLRANAAALKELGAGLKLNYLQPPERSTKSDDKLGMKERELARLLLVESHERAASGDWDGAAQSLLNVQRMGVQSAHGGDWRAFLSGLQIRKMAHDDLWHILPHLSAIKARDAARQLENSVPVEPAQALEEEKRATQSAILELIRERDWRPLYAQFACIDGCEISEEEKQRALNDLPALLKMRLAWMNKPKILEEYARNMNEQIARARQPYSIANQHWPLSTKYESDAVEQMIHLQLSTWLDFTTNAQERLLTTALALHAYHEDKEVYPRTLSQLVPDYLARVPLDPFSKRQTLRYTPKSKKYVVGFNIVPAPPGVAALGEAPIGVPGTEVEPIKIYKSQPYTLWSRGLNARDDGGSSCVLPDETNIYKRYGIRVEMRETKCDIVAGINH